MSLDGDWTMIFSVLNCFSCRSLNLLFGFESTIVFLIDCCWSIIGCCCPLPNPLPFPDCSAIDAAWRNKSAIQRSCWDCRAWFCIWMGGTVTKEYDRNGVNGTDGGVVSEIEGNGGWGGAIIWIWTGNGWGSGGRSASWRQLKMNLSFVKFW